MANGFHERVLAVHALVEQRSWQPTRPLDRWRSHLVDEIEPLPHAAHIVGPKLQALRMPAVQHIAARVVRALFAPDELGHP